MDLYHYLFKFIIVGDTSEKDVGKSCLLLNYTEKKFREEHDTTIGVEFGSQLFKLNEKIIKIQIWDTAGQESFRSITRSYYKGSIGVILVFDITNQESFYNIEKWYNEVTQSTNQNATIYLVGNKIDLENKRTVPTLQAQELADQYKLKYFETSAKSSMNVDLLFESMATNILQKINNQELDFTNDQIGVKLGTYYQDQFKQKQTQEDTQQQKKDGCC